MSKCLTSHIDTKQVILGTLFPDNLFNFQNGELPSSCMINCQISYSVEKYRNFQIFMTAALLYLGMLKI